MNNNDFVKKTIKYGIDYFLYSLNSLIDDKIHAIRDELNKNIDRLDIDTIENVVVLLKSLNSKNSTFKKIIFYVAGIENNTLKKRQKIKVLLDKITTDLNLIELDIEENKDSIINIESLIKELKKIKSSFIDLSKKERISRLNFYLNEIDENIKILDAFSYTLLLKSVNLLQIKQIYTSLQGIKNGTII